MGLFGRALEARMKDPVEGTARVVMCSAPSIGSTSSNYTLDCVVTAPGLASQAVQHKGMAPVDKWPQRGVDLPIVVDRRHPSRFVIKWDRIDKDPLEDWIAGGKQRAQALAAQMRGCWRTIRAQSSSTGRLH